MWHRAIGSNWNRKCFAAAAAAAAATSDGEKLLSLVKSNQTDNVSSYLVNIEEHIAAKEPDISLNKL